MAFRTRRITRTHQGTGIIGQRPSSSYYLDTQPAPGSRERFDEHIYIDFPAIQYDEYGNRIPPREPSPPAPEQPEATTYHDLMAGIRESVRENRRLLRRLCRREQRRNIERIYGFRIDPDDQFATIEPWVRGSVYRRVTGLEANELLNDAHFYRRRTLVPETDLYSDDDDDDGDSSSELDESDSRVRFLMNYLAPPIDMTGFRYRITARIHASMLERRFRYTSQNRGDSEALHMYSIMVPEVPIAGGSIDQDDFYDPTTRMVPLPIGAIVPRSSTPAPNPEDSAEGTDPHWRVDGFGGGIPTRERPVERESPEGQSNPDDRTTLGSILEDHSTVPSDSPEPTAYSKIYQRGDQRLWG
ncbi:hypothetical protein TWF481_003911 [Arthrobotrys musiformis]|uniref:Uncharacterized protein n=1 Tax=Arthrobotrys musiformis TaxID=47236 RepID=A0AAV9WI22_9PEZI